jgi:hypothetical protein
VGVLGSSPPTRTSSVERHGRDAPYYAAKKWWKRLSYDSSLDAEHFTVGGAELGQLAIAWR